MTDQAITLKNTLRVGGSQGTTSVPLRVDGVTAQTANMQEMYTLAADAQPVYAVSKAGLIQIGPGGASVVDTTIGRASAGNVSVSGGLVTTEISTPSAPGASKGMIYFKSDDLPYYRAGAAGSETAFSAGGSGSTDGVAIQVWGG